MVIPAPTVSVDDQEYYPLHEEDDVPELPPHREWVTYAYNALRAHFPTWFITSNVCIYWEPGNTEAYRAPDLFAVKEPLTEPVARVYQTWKQPAVAFVMEVGSKSTFRTDEGPKVAEYQDLVKAREYLYTNPPKGDKRLWRLGPRGYDEVAPAANGRLRSEELGLEFDLVAGFPRFYTLDGEQLPTHEETAERLEETAERLEETAGQLEETAERLEEAEERRRVAEQQAAVEGQQRQAAEERAAAEERQREQAEARAAEEAARRAELERQLADLQARLADRTDA
jgi:Uma2 family endonuclease